MLTKEFKAKYIREYFPELELINNRTIADKTVEIWVELWENSEFKNIELALMERRFSEARSSGYLLAHVRNVVHTVLALGKTVEQETGNAINWDILITAAILHDASSVLAFHADGGQTELGALMPHSSIVCGMCYKMGFPIEVIHCIASHSPSSSKKPPQTLEALILHYADYAIFDITQFIAGRETKASQKWR